MVTESYNDKSNNNFNNIKDKILKLQKVLVNDMKNDNNSYINSFSAFKSINNNYYLIYAIGKAILLFDLFNNKKLAEIKDAHNAYIRNFIHYSDEINKRDLLISFTRNDLKLWNIRNCDCLLNIQNIIKFGYLSSACFLNYNNNIYIIICNDSRSVLIPNPEAIKVFDLKGMKIKDINDSHHFSSFIDVYFDKKSSKNYIITGNDGFSISYDYSLNKLYHKYDEKNDLSQHFCVSIHLVDDEIKLIELCYNRYIKIWNFHTEVLLKKINISSLQFCSILKNDYFVLGGSEIKIIKFKDLNEICDLSKINNESYESYFFSNFITVKKLMNPYFGESFLINNKKEILLYSIK